MNEPCIVHPLELIFNDDALLVADKPAGLLAVPGRGADKQDCLSARIQAEFPDALVVHRLDMATSGLMVFGRGVEMQRRLSRLFHDRKVAKRYVAVVSGKLEVPAQVSPSLALPRGERGRLAIPSGNEKGGLRLLPSGEGWEGGWGEISLPLNSDWPNRPRQRVDHEAGKHSLTRYRVLTYNTDTDTSRVELEPVTGRTHQLRVHLSASGHPIVGDTLYGGIPAERLMLHASWLAFAHPHTGEGLEFRSEAAF